MGEWYFFIYPLKLVTVSIQLTNSASIKSNTAPSVVIRVCFEPGSMRSGEFIDPGSKHTGMTSMEVFPYHAVLSINTRTGYGENRSVKHVEWCSRLTHSFSASSTAAINSALVTGFCMVLTAPIVFARAR
jgi:hypothetical protein